MFDLSFGSIGYVVTSLIYFTLCMYVLIKSNKTKVMGLPKFILCIVTVFAVSFVPYVSASMIIITALLSFVGLTRQLLGYYDRKQNKVY